MTCESSEHKSRQERNGVEAHEVCACVCVCDA